MPLSYTTHTVASTASGSGLQFSVNYPYILRSHVKVYYGRDILAGTHTSLLVDGNDYNWTTDTQITLTAAPSSTSTLTIIRETPTDAQQVVWQDGSNLIADDLNTADKQNLYVVQEQQDRNSLGATEARNATTAANNATNVVATSVVADGSRAMTGNLNLDSNKVINLANPTAGGDAVNKTFADATYQPLDAELTELATMAGNTASALADLTQAEVNILDGATVSTSELNILDGVTANASELNKLDGVTSSTAELNILDGVTATAAEINALDGITASVDELNKLDGVTATTAELNFVDGVTSGIQAQLDAKQPLDAELTELATMQSGTASALADLTQAEVQVLDGATLSTTELNKLDGITSTTSELNILDGVTANATELNVTDGLTASTSELNQLDGKTISSTLTPANTNDIPTSSAVNTFVSGLLNALGGFVAIPNETSFPTTNPDPSDNAGTVVSIADAGGVVVNSSGVSTTGRTTGNATVTINGFPSSLQSTTLGAGLGLQVQTTTTLNTYTYHKLIAKETDVVQLSDDINDFNERYRVSDNAPTTDLDEGDLWYDRTANKMKVYDTSTSAWKEVQSVGNFFINTLSSSSGTGGGSATFNGSAYRFTLSNAGANAQQMLVSVNGVIQKPNSGTSQPSEGFAIDNNDIIFAAAPASGANHFIITQGSTVNIGQPSNNTVDTSELVDGAVTNAKVSSSAAISGTKISPDFGSQQLATGGIQVTNNVTPTSGSGVEIFSPSSTAGQVQAFNRTGSAWMDLILKGNTQQFYTGSSERLRILSDGSIATGGLTATPGTVAAGSYIQNAANAGFFGNNGDAKFGSSANNPVLFQVNGSEKVRIDTSGNLGIGTSVPTQKLDVRGNIYVGDKIGINTTSPDQFLDIESSSTTTARVTAHGYICRDNWGSVSSLGNGMVSPASNTLAFATNSTERFRVDSSGRLLCGTTSAGSNGTADDLVVANDGSASDQAGITIRGGTSGRSQIFFSDGTSGDAEYRGMLRYDHSDDSMQFRTSSAERLRISDVGDILFNTTSGLSSGLVSIAFDTSRNGMVLKPTNSTLNQNYLVFINSAGTTAGKIEQSGTTSTNYVTSSDYRLKENIVDLDGAITRVKQLAPKRFNFIGETDRTVDGFLAHEAQTVVPEAISGTHNGVEVWKEGQELPEGVSVGDNKLDEDGNTIPDYQGIDQSKLVPLLTAALKEAINKIETLETQNASLEARLTALEGAS